MDSLSSSIVEADDVATAARFVLLSKRGDSTAAADFLRRTLAEVDGSALDLTTLNSTLGYDFMGADMRSFSENAQTPTSVPFVGDEIDRQAATLVLLIPGDMHIVGHLIGKGGLEIGKIESESGASVKIEAQSQVHSNVPIATNSNIMQLNERVVTVSGTVASCCRAQRLLDRRLRQRLESDGIHREVLRIVVPNEFVRHLIGKNGCNITQLQSQTAIRIQVQAEANMASHQIGRVVTFQGAEHGRAMAQYLVSRQIADGPFRDWPMQQPVSPSASSSWPSSPLASEWASQTDTKSQGPNGITAASEHFSASPSFSNVVADVELVLSDVGPTSRSTYDDDVSDPSYCLDLTVPNLAVAFLIGKGGATVSEMEAKSGARIRIAKQANSDSGRVVSIRGTPSSVRMAQNLVQSRIEAYLQVHGYLRQQ